jgi:hypothetical protein
VGNPATLSPKFCESRPRKNGHSGQLQPGTPAARNDDWAPTVMTTAAASGRSLEGSASTTSVGERRDACRSAMAPGRSDRSRDAATAASGLGSSGPNLRVRLHCHGLESAVVDGGREGLVEEAAGGVGCAAGAGSGEFDRRTGRSDVPFDDAAERGTGSRAPTVISPRAPRRYSPKRVRRRCGIR